MIPIPLKRNLLQRQIYNEKLGMGRLAAVPAIERKEFRFTAASSARGEHLFRRAARHSRFIRFLRIAIPIGVLAGIGLIVAVVLNPFGTPVNVSFDKGKLVVSGTKIAMELPRLAGFTSDSLPYELTAEVATQDLSDPGTLELQNLKAQIETKDQGLVEITAAKGIFNVKADLLRLVDNILLQSSIGYEARLREATIDLKKGTVVSEAQVETKFPEGTLKANRLDISENGEIVLFSEGVQTFLKPGSADLGPSQAGSQ